MRGRTVSRSRRGGFTLIELLVVISIIALLISLLLPSLGAAKDQALSTQCLSNQKAMGLGWHSYITAYNKLAGMNGFDAWVWGSDWGTGGRYDGGPSAWAPVKATYIPYLGYAPVAGTYSWYSRIGYVYPYVSGNNGLSNAYNDGTGKLFYCPGNDSSFGRADGWPGRPSAAYSTWNGTAGKWNGTTSMTGMDRFGWGGKNAPEGPQESGTFTTYYFRGGSFEKNTYLSDSNVAGWGSGFTAAPNYLNNAGAIPTPDDPAVPGKPFLTCMWVNYNVPAGETIPNRIALGKGSPHKAKFANLAWTDGSAKTWKMPQGVIAPVDIYDRAWNATQFTAVNRTSQTPWYFVLAKRDRDGSPLSVP